MIIPERGGVGLLADSLCIPKGIETHLAHRLVTLGLLLLE